MFPAVQRLDHHVVSAFDDDKVFPAVPHDGGHQLTVGVKGQFPDPGVEFFQFFPAPAVFFRGRRTIEVSVGSPMWVSLPSSMLTVPLQQRVPYWSSLTPPLRQGVHLFRGVFAVHPDLHDRHPVLGEGAGLIRADNRGTAQRLDRRQPRIIAFFLTIRWTPRERTMGDNRRQPFRMAETASETEVIKMSSGGMSLNSR